MKNKLILIILFVLVFVVFMPRPVMVHAIPPPYITISVFNPPSDLKLSIRYSKNNVTITKLLERRDIAWKTEFYLWYHDFLRDRELYYNVFLIVESLDYNFEVPLPDEGLDYTLDLKSQNLYEGYPVWHGTFSTILRIIVTILLEAVVFFLFAYREKRSWILFLIVNLITNGALHICVGFLSDDSAASIFFEIIGATVIVAEMIAFAAALEEQSRWKAILYAFVANFLSLVLGTYLLGMLPL